MTTLLPILTYQQVVSEEEMPPDPHLYVSPQTLAEHVIQLKHAGFEFVTLSRAWEHIRAGTSAQRACLTFDSISAAFFRHALPMLQELKVTATLFPVVRTIGPGDQQPLLSPGLFGPSEDLLRAAADQGFEIGSQTMTHRELTTLGDRELRTELSDSRKRLGRIIGNEVRSLCYPRGRFSERVVRFAEAAGYACACTTLPGNLQGMDRQYELRRIPVGTWCRGWRLTLATRRVYEWLHQKRSARAREGFLASDRVTEAED
jgi:peptidoglycan/xylan/chitin deacetylase (PgdA/CDA1 family)